MFIKDNVEIRVGTIYLCYDCPRGYDSIEISETFKRKGIFVNREIDVVLWENKTVERKGNTHKHGHN